MPDPHVPQLVQRDAEAPLHDQLGAAGASDDAGRDAQARGHRRAGIQVVVGHGHDRTVGRLGEQPHERVALEPDAHADTVGEARLDQRLRQSAVGQVVGPGEDPGPRRVDQQPGQVLLLGQVDHGRPPAEVSVDDVRPLRAGELLPGLAEVHHGKVRRGEAGDGTPGHVVDHPEHGHDRGRQDRGVTGLVVEAHVAAGHRDAQLQAPVLQPAAGLGELPHHPGILRGAEVEAVGDGQRGRAADGDVAVGLRERELGAGVRVQLGEPPVAVGGERDAEVRCASSTRTMPASAGWASTVLPRT